MAAGDAFTMDPTQVIPEEPIYNNVITLSETMKKDYQNISSTPIKKYKLIFEALTTTNKDAFLTHYNDQYGGYHSFSWTSVPSYIGGGTNITGRWVADSLEITPILSTVWKISIIFEKDN